MSNKTCTNSPVGMLMYQELFVLAKRYSGLLLSFCYEATVPSSTKTGFCFFGHRSCSLVFNDLIVSIMVEGTQVVQVTNIAPVATLEQLKTLFSFLGEIEDIAMYPDE